MKNIVWIDCFKSIYKHRTIQVYIKWKQKLGKNRDDREIIISHVKHKVRTTKSILGMMDLLQNHK